MLTGLLPLSYTIGRQQLRPTSSLSAFSGATTDVEERKAAETGRSALSSSHKGTGANTAEMFGGDNDDDADESFEESDEETDDNASSSSSQSSASASWKPSAFGGSRAYQ